MDEQVEAQSQADERADAIKTDLIQLKQVVRKFLKKTQYLPSQTACVCRSPSLRAIDKLLDKMYVLSQEKEYPYNWNKEQF